MNLPSIPTFQSPRELFAGRRGDSMAVHFGVTDTSANRVCVLADNPFAWHYQVTGFRCLLVRALDPRVVIGAHGDLRNGLIRFSSSDRDLALSLSLDFFAHIVPWVEVAWHHEAEDHWATLHPNPAVLPFARHLTNENDQDRSERSASFEQTLRIFIDAAKASSDEPPHNPK